MFVHKESVNPEFTNIFSKNNVYLQDSLNIDYVKFKKKIMKSL